MLTGLAASDVLSALPSPTIALEIPLTVPVNVGDAKLALISSAVCCAVETGLAASDVLSALASPTIALEIPLTVPVNVGDAKLALRSSAICCAVETGLAASDVLSALPSPTIALEIPLTVPVNVGDANVAYVDPNVTPFSYMVFDTYKFSPIDTLPLANIRPFNDKSSDTINA